MGRKDRTKSKQYHAMNREDRDIDQEDRFMSQEESAKHWEARDMRKLGT